MSLHYNFKILDQEINPAWFDSLDWIKADFTWKICVILRGLFCSSKKSPWVHEAVQQSYNHWYIPLTVMIPWHDEDAKKFTFTRYEERARNTFEQIIPESDSVRIISHSSWYAGYINDILEIDKVIRIDNFAPAALLEKIWDPDIALLDFHRRLAERYLAMRNSVRINRKKIKQEVREWLYDLRKHSSFWFSPNHNLYLNPWDKVIPFTDTLEIFWAPEYSTFWNYNPQYERVNYKEHFLLPNDIKKIFQSEESVNS